MDSMSDIVWSLNPRYDNFENILIRMKQFSSELCEPQQINLIFQIPENLEGIKLAADKRKIYSSFLKKPLTIPLNIVRATL